MSTAREEAKKAVARAMDQAQQSVIATLQQDAPQPGAVVRFNTITRSKRSRRQRRG